VPVAARAMPGASGSWLVELGPEAGVARDVQRAATRAHASQSETLPWALACLDGPGGRERLRWLVHAASRTPAPRASEQCLN
jgi:hypothetical protein